MPLYAVDDDDLIFAPHAENGKTYWCLDCFGPLKKRSGRKVFPHFYHIHPAPSCRLHSKTEDHLRAQIQIQKQFPPNALQMERPFPEINRVADLCWQDRKIVFEIQCSPMSEVEAKGRIKDYASIGFSVIWLLDDKRYNRKSLRPSEEFLRKNGAYYICIEQGLQSKCYDQFEVFSLGKRVARGPKMYIDPQDLRLKPDMQFNQDTFPRQIREISSPHYFCGDRVDKALRAQNNPHTACNLLKWLSLEIQLGKNSQKKHRIKIILDKYLIEPYLALLMRLLKQAR